MLTHPTYCYGCRAVHELTVADRERLIYTLQAAEQTAAMDPPDGRDMDTWDCLETWLNLSHEVDGGYGEHLEQAVGLRRDLAGDRPGDEDLCHCGDLIVFVELTAATGSRTTIRRWEHKDPQAWECRTAAPYEGRGA